MTTRFNLSDKISLNQLFDAAKEWENLPINELGTDQLAILNLKKVILDKLEYEGTAKKAGGIQCLICASGA